MTPKFTIGKERIMIGEKYLCNGHWLASRDAALSPMAPKPLKLLLSVKTGTYHDGVAAGLSVETTPDFASVIPKRDGYLILKESPSGVEFRGDSTEIMAYVYEAGDFKIGVAHRYVPLLGLGRAFAKDSSSPIIVLDGDTLNDNLLAVVMPMRLTQAGGAQ